MRDLFSQCTCVRAYVRTYVTVTLRNVNLRSRPGRISDTTCITRRRRDDVFGDGGREDSAAGPSQRTYLAESSAEANTERSRRLATLTKRSIHSRARREQDRVQQ